MAENRKAQAESGATLAAKRLRQAQPTPVSGLFWYGAVDLNPEHLVVWVMLNGHADRLPRWFFPTGNREVDEPLAFGLLDQLYELDGLVQQAFAEAGWPVPMVAVGFESEDRSRGEGGWQYFK